MTRPRLARGTIELAPNRQRRPDDPIGSAAEPMGRVVRGAVAEADKPLPGSLDDVAAPPRNDAPPLRRRAAWGSTRDIIVMASLAAVYFACAKVALRLAIVHPSATPIWPPTGIALASILLLGYRAWPGIFLGALLANATTAGSLATSLGIAAGNTLEGLAGALLVNRFANGPRAFERAKDTFLFAILAGTIGAAVSPTLGVTSLALGGFARWADFGPIWLTWWLGDMGGALIVAPLLILWRRDGRFHWNRPRVIEAVIVLIVLLVVGQAVFGWLRPIGAGGLSLKFLCMPMLAWVAFRFDRRTAAIMLFAISALAVLGTLRGYQIHGSELNQSLLMTQVFMAVLAVTTLALAAVVYERERVEGEVRATSEELREAVTELEAFGHAISHDLRSPIGAVLNYTAIIEEDARGRLDGEELRLLGRIRASALSAAHLLDQLVNFSWVSREAGERMEVDMTSLARTAYLEVAAGAEGAASAAFEIQDLPTARGNAALLGRVFRNLFSNAVKYTRGRDGRRIVVSGHAGARENTYSVTDNGIGFDPTLAHALFQPFRRLTSSKDFEGSGLGLAIVAKIIRRHGGRIGAESDGSSGARFWFTLPHREGDA